MRILGDSLYKDFQEVLTGKDTSAKLILPKFGLSKLYERSIRGFVYTVDPKQQLNCPVNNSKDSLGLQQPFLCFQMNLCGEHLQINVEVIVKDSLKRKRRIIFSTSFQKIMANELHCQIPFRIEDPQNWHTLIFDIGTVTSVTFPGSSFASIDSFSVRSNGLCKIRKVFTVTDDTAEIPQLVNFAPFVEWNLLRVGTAFSCESRNAGSATEPDEMKSISGLQIQGNAVSAAVVKPTASQQQERMRAVIQQKKEENVIAIDEKARSGYEVGPEDTVMASTADEKKPVVAKSLRHKLLSSKHAGGEVGKIGLGRRPVESNAIPPLDDDLKPALAGSLGMDKFGPLPIAVSQGVKGSILDGNGALAVPPAPPLPAAIPGVSAVMLVSETTVPYYPAPVEKPMVDALAANIPAVESNSHTHSHELTTALAALEQRLALTLQRLDLETRAYVQEFGGLD